MQQITDATRPAEKTPLYSLVVAWVLLFPLLCFAAEYSFSFESGGINSGSGSSFAAQGMSEGSPVLRAQKLVGYLICSLLMVPFVRIIAADFRRNLLIFSLPMLAFASCVWSQNAGKTFASAILLFLAIALSFYLLERFTANEIMQLFLLVGVVAEVASLFLITFIPRFGLQNRAIIVSGAWQGIFSQKNTCGEAMTFLMLAAFFVRVETQFLKFLRVGYILVALLIIAMSHSAGAWVICGSSLLFIVTMHLLLRMPRQDIAVVALIFLGVGVITGIAVYEHFDVLMLALGKDPTMTKRTILWAALVPSILKHPLLGYGFMAFWQGLAGESANAGLIMNWPGISYAENGVIELCLELGTFGVALYLLVFLRAVRNGVYCFVRQPSSAVMWYLSLLFALAISNTAGGVLLSPIDLKFLLPMIAFIGLRREAQRIETLRIN